MLDVNTNELSRLTNTMSPSIDSEELFDGEVVRYLSFDGLKIPAILYRPKRASAEYRVSA